ncbi:MAG: hypothetical protein FD129_3406, partial [bacterium]
MTVIARAGNASGSVTLTLISKYPKEFVTSVPTTAATTFTSVRVGIDFLGEYFLHTGVPVQLSIIDAQGAAGRGTFQPPTATSIDGHVESQLTIGPLTDDELKTGLQGYVLAQIGELTRLTPFRITPAGTGTGSGGSNAPVFPDSVVMTPSSLRMAVRAGATLAIPIAAQFPGAARDAQYTISVTPALNGGTPGSF